MAHENAPTRNFLPARFRAKWVPVRVKKTRQTKPEPGFDSINAGRLEPAPVNLENEKGPARDLTAGPREQFGLGRQ